jgi:hypothetical protein
MEDLNNEGKKRVTTANILSGIFVLDIIQKKITEAIKKKTENVDSIRELLESSNPYDYRIARDPFDNFIHHQIYDHLVKAGVLPETCDEDWDIEKPPPSPVNEPMKPVSNEHEDCASFFIFPLSMEREREFVFASIDYLTQVTFLNNL